MRSLLQQPRLLLLLVFCQTAMAQPARVLILDKAMSPPYQIAVVAKPFIANGCSVNYRRYYPFFVQDDQQHYDIFALCGSNLPGRPMAPIARQDLDFLAAALHAGRGVVLLYPETAGGINDRAAMNQFLREINARLGIGEVLLQDTEHTYQTLLGEGLLARQARDWRHASVHRVAVGRASPLRVFKDARAEIPLEAYSTAHFRKATGTFRGRLPVVALTSVQGPLLVAPMALFTIAGSGPGENHAPALRPDLMDSTAAFLQDVIHRFLELYRGAELALTPVPENSALPVRAEHNLPDVPILTSHPRRIALPVEITTFAEGDYPDREVVRLQNRAYFEGLAGLPAFEHVSAHGIRAVRGRLTPYFTADGRMENRKSTADIEALATFARDSQLNLVLTVATPQALTERRRFNDAALATIEQQWKQLLRALLRTESQVVLATGLDPGDLPIAAPRAVTLQGSALASPSPVDFAFWWHGLQQPIRAMVRTLHAYQPPFAGIFLQGLLTMPMPDHNPAMDTDFSDPAYVYFLSVAGSMLSEAEMEIAREQPVSQRFVFLARHGLLPLYFDVLQDMVEQACRKLKRQVARLAPNLLWVLTAESLPADWFSWGVLRGLSDPLSPVVLITPDLNAPQALPHLRDQDIYVLHAADLYPFRFSFDNLRDLIDRLARQHQGFCVNSWEALLTFQERPAAILSTKELVRVLRATASSGHR